MDYGHEPRGRGEGGGGHFLVWPERIRATEPGVVFRVLSLRQGVQFHFLAS